MDGSFPGLLVSLPACRSPFRKATTPRWQAVVGGSDFPVYLGKVVHTNLHATGGEYFNAGSSFVAPALGTFGATSRRFFFGPGTDNTDFALHKITQDYGRNRR